MRPVALLSTHARSARCYLRTSSPSPRRLRIQQAGQYDLPFPIETAMTDHRYEIDPVPQLLPACSAGEISAPKNSRIQLRHARMRPNPKRKPPARTNAPLEEKVLVSRKEAAAILSISIRGVDYMIADGRLSARRIANRVLIPTEEIRKFAQSDHPRRLAG